MTTYFKNFTQRDVRDVDLSHGTGVTYRHFDGPVLWPFGYGLSYSTFSYKWSDGPSSSAPALRIGTAAQGTTDHEVVVTNTGTVAGDCVVLAFAVADENYQGTNKDAAGAPLKKMFGFQRLRDMAPGEKRTVMFSSTAEDLSVVDAGGSRWLKPRRAWIEIGDVAAPARRELAIEGEDRLLEAAGTWAEAAVEYLAK